MSESVFLRLRPFLSDIPRIALDGWGEPLTDPNIFEKTRTCHEAGCYTQFATNATFLTEEKVPKLFDSGLDLLLVSVDGASKETFEAIRRGADFDQVIENVYRAIRARNLKGLRKPVITLLYTLTRANRHEVVEFAEMAAKLQVDSICIKHRDVWAKEADVKESILGEDCSGILGSVEDCLRGKPTKLEPFSRLYLGRGKTRGNCYANAAAAAFVSWQGDVSPCCILGHAARRVIAPCNGQSLTIRSPHFCLGNIMREGLNHIWNKKSYRDFRRSIASGATPSQCVGCNLI